MATMTARELRLAAAILDVLTKARIANQHMGIPTTPDVFTARFPTGLIAVVRWVPGARSTDPKRQRALERATRHRDSYQLDLTTPPGPTVIALRDPQSGKRPAAVEDQPAAA